MVYYKNARLKPAKGGYIITATKYTMSKNPYEGESYVGECEEVFNDGTKAMKRLDEMYATEVINSMKRAKAKAKQEEEEDESMEY